MSMLYEPVLITTSTNLSFNNRVYMVNSSGAITLTLPLITCEGIRLKITRVGTNTSATVSLAPTAPNLIYLSSTTTTSSYSIPYQNSIEISSVNGQWYLTNISNLDANGGGSLLSGVCVGNNSNIYQVLSAGNASRIVITGSAFETLIPKIFVVTIYNISATALFSGVFELIQGGNNVMVITISSVPAGYSIYTTSTVINPLYNTAYFIRWTATGGGASDKIGLCSIRIY